PETNDFLQAPSAQAVERACQQALDSAGIAPGDVAYIEVLASGIGDQDQAEINGLHRAYRLEPSSCAIGSVKANIGHTFAASGMASLIKTALCLHQRYIPAVPGWTGPKRGAGGEFQDSPFYVAAESRPWFADGTKRVAAINGLGLDRTCAHLILSEHPGQPERETPGIYATRPFFFPIVANRRAALLDTLAALQQTIENADSLRASEHASLLNYQNRPDAAFALAIVGHDKEELVREIQFASQGVGQAFEQGQEWQSPLGSYFSARPLAQRGTVAFVYPGAFNAYVGLGREIFAFPGLYERFARITSNTARSVADEFLYPRSLDKLSPGGVQACAERLVRNPTAIIESGTSFAVLYTMIMRDYFGVQAQSAFGYSLGEASMMWASGVWSAGDQGSAAWHAS
ncbi:MAG: type I polyketide synthase, partial [Delftia sp.]|nr:type I polyketide synthase [Delftia sp.]